MSLLWDHRRNIAISFGVEKPEWCGYPMLKMFEGMITLFDTIHERDRTDTRTDRQTDGQTPHDGIGCDYAYSIQCAAWLNSQRSDKAF